MKKDFLVPLVLLLVSAFVFSGCAAPAPELPPVKIGVMYPLTGPGAMEGEKFLNGAMFAFEEVGFEVASRKIEVIVEDSAAQTEVALDKARKLVEHDKVSALIGPVIGGTKVAVANYMTQMEVPHILDKPSPMVLAEQEWCFMAGGSEPQQPSAMGCYAYDEMGIRKVTIIAADMIEGHNFAAAFKHAFEGRGGQVVQEQYPPFVTTDFASYLATLKDADAVVAWFVGVGTIPLLVQYHEFGIRQKMPLIAAFHGGFFVPHMLNALPPEVADAMIGEHCPTPYTALIETDASKQFVEAFKKAKGYIPDESESSAYTGVSVALEALKATGGDTTPEKLRQAIMAVSFETPEGPIRFDPETRFAIRNIYIAQVTKAEWGYDLAPVYTYKDVPPSGY